MDEALKIAEIPDYPGALNGMQLENSGQVSKVIAAVDASLPVIEKAVARGGDLLIVHHGMFWQGAQPLTGSFYRKIHSAMQANMAIYSAHLPLDVHPEWGNNACLARELGMEVDGNFLEWKGMPIGLLGTLEVSRDELVRKLEAAVGGSVHLCPGGSLDVGKIGLCTGGAGSQIADAAAAGVNTLITGEGPHWSYSMAEELGVNLLYAGHYATETFGVKALAAELAERFTVDWELVDHPTGL